MSSPKRELWLVRHGETPASRGHRLAGWVDLPLTERGEAQASALRPLLDAERFQGVWSSDLQRAVNTALLAFPFGEARPDRRLRELHFGSLEGRYWPELEGATLAALHRFEGFAAPEGESFDELRTRVLSFIEELDAGRHLVFTHGGVVRLLSREAGQDEFVTTGSLVVMDWESRRVLRRHDGDGSPPPAEPRRPPA